LAPLTRRTGGVATYPDLSAFRRGGPTAPILGLDHLYASPGLALRRVDRLSRLGSDHLAVRAEFTRAGPARP
jgi:endonuclease/exonuclease/phosphatase (EEP) superfamily protein YafD